MDIQWRKKGSYLAGALLVYTILLVYITNIDQRKTILKTMSIYQGSLTEMKGSNASSSLTEIRGSNDTSNILIEQPTMIYAITPTYSRSSQRPDLTRLCQTLMHIENLHWIVIEDGKQKSLWVEDLLNRSGLNFTHFAVTKTSTEKGKVMKGCASRNKALTWIKDHVTEGVICFTDDDNSYDLRFFEEIRSIKTVGLLPTGNFDKTGVSSPVVVNGIIKDFVDIWTGPRKFPVDMASIGINVKHYLSKGAPIFNANWTPGYLETKLMESLVSSKEEIEPKADNCTKIYVWHTQTAKLGHVYKKHTNSSKFINTNIRKLMEGIVFHG